MNIGILTGGGDCPGLNAVIRAVVKRGLQLGHEFTGIKEGWRGLLDLKTVKLGPGSVSGLLPLGGTILGPTRTNPFKNEKDAEKLIMNINELKLDALVCIGGDDTLSVASKLHDRGIKTVGVPKTIDNDLSGTDFTFGFDTAVSIVTWALDRLHSTTEAHQGAIVVEVRGSHAGGGAGGFLASEIEKSLGLESRFVVLGHLQRGGTPTAYDRVLATRFGVKAIELLNEGKYGRMVALRGN